MATKAGSMHRPVGSNNRIDSFAADCSIRDRSSQSSCSIAVANRFTGEEPLDHDEENASRTTAQSSSSGHASFHGMPLFSRSPAAIHRRTRLPQCFRPQSARVEWTLLDVSPRSTFPISRAMADRMTAQRQNRADFWPATIHTAMSRQRRPPLPASAMPSSSHMLLPHQPANPIPADGITAAGEAEAHPSFHVFHKESQGMGSHAFP